MLSRVLVPVDGSETATRALAYALENHADTEIIVLHVVGEPSPMWGSASGLALEDDIEQAARERAEEVLSPARELATEYSVEIRTEIKFGDPTKAIVDAANDFDLVVLGSHSGTMVERLFVGNVARSVVRQSPVPVTVVG
jgi:nucleotide-binding universal stress UspA family protein